MKFQNNFTIKKNIQIWKWKSFSPQFGSINDIRVMTSLRDTKDLCASIKLSADTTKTRIQTGFMFSPGQARHNWPSLPGLRRLVLGERQRGTTNGQIVFPLGALSCFGGKCGASTAPFRAPTRTTRRVQRCQMNTNMFSILPLWSPITIFKRRSYVAGIN